MKLNWGWETNEMGENGEGIFEGLPPPTNDNTTHSNSNQSITKTLIQSNTSDPNPNPNPPAPPPPPALKSALKRTKPNPSPQLQQQQQEEGIFTPIFMLFVFHLILYLLVFVTESHIKLARTTRRRGLFPCVIV